MAQKKIQPIQIELDADDILPTQTSNAGKYLKSDGTNATWQTSGDVVGPASATDNAIVRFDGTTGKLVQGSGVTISDTSDNITTSGSYIGYDIAVNDVYTNTVEEKTASAGVTIDGVLLKDGGLNGIPIITTTDAQTITNKRITPRNTQITSASTITPTSDATDQYDVTALATAATIAAPSGTPTNGQKLLMRIKDNGTARSLTWNAIYRGIGVTLPIATVASKTIYVGMVYNAQDSKWDVIAVAAEA